MDDDMMGDHPPSQFPTVFADGVMNLANSDQIVKFYLYRLDPSFSNEGKSLPQAFAQVVMSMDGFGQTVTFFQDALGHLVEQGHISEEYLLELRAARRPREGRE